MKRIIALLVAALVTTAVLATTAQATTVACLDNTTTTLPAVLEFDGVFKTLSESTGAQIASQGSKFFIGRLKGSGQVVFAWDLPDNLKPEDVFESYAGHEVHIGSCSGMFMQPPRNFWGCDHPAQSDPTEIGNEGTAESKYDKGVTVPLAYFDVVSRTKLNAGIYLRCGGLLPGYAIKSGAAVSTGGGEIYDSTGTIPGAIKATPSYVLELLTAKGNRGDYTVLVIKA